jgi:hypothetical protein
MKFLSRLFGRFRKAEAAVVIDPTEGLSYAEILRGADVGPRIGLAARVDAPPEVLFVLSADPMAEVRRNVAANPSTPGMVVPILVRDGDVDVRKALLTRTA